MPDSLLKVLIVDDEHLVRNLLRNCINWEEIGYEVIGEASNANEALDLVDQLRPDVIFTDIYMPFMDGLEFGKIVFEKYASIKIIVLTGYEEFEYAKKSIKIGIADFLLKPINDDEIRKVALNMKAKIESERNQRAEYDRAKKQLEENLPYLKEKLLNKMIQGSFEHEDLQQQMDYFHVNINPYHIQVAAIEGSLSESGNDNTHEEERLLLTMQCCEMVAKYFRNDSYVHIFLDNNQNIVVLNSEPSIDFPECLEAVRALVINKLKCSVSIGVGNCYTSEVRIRTSYKEALNALAYKIVAGKNQVISYQDINFSQSAEPISLQNDYSDALSFALKAGMKKKVAEFIEGAFADGLGGSKLRIASMRARASNILSILLNVITEIEINMAEIFPGNSQPFDQVFKIDTLPDMKDYLLKLAENTINIILSMQSKKVNQSIEQVKDYLQQNLADPEMSLSNTAKKFYMNMSYLSRIFKQETGYTFVEYLTKARMEKAIKLLKETDMKAYQIAEEVGIINPHYFGICFKKWTGVSVNDFKKAE